MSDEKFEPHLFWWEKTVEYAFVLEVLPRTATSAFPMDGNPEKAFGDALFVTDLAFRLVEFKALQSDIGAEREKFGFKPGTKSPDGKTITLHNFLTNNFGRLVEQDGHNAHWLVFGRAAASARPLELFAQGYSADEALRDALNAANFSELSSASYAQMQAYLNVLEEFRGAVFKGDDDGDGGEGGGGGATRLATNEADESASSSAGKLGDQFRVVGVRSNGESVAMTVAQFRSIANRPHPKRQARTRVTAPPPKPGPGKRI